MTRIRYAVIVSAMAVAILLNVAALYLRTDAQSGPNRAGLVVQYPDGRVTTRCVTFTEPEITGYDLMRRANLALLADVSGGGLVCKIGNTGCNFPAQQCFCDCQDLNQTCIYWIYYFQANHVWKYASLGPFTQKVTNGSVNGWIYAPGSASSASVMPPLISIDDICQSAPAPTALVATVPATTRVPAMTSTPSVMASTVTPVSVADVLTTPVPSAAAPVSTAAQIMATASITPLPVTLSVTTVATEQAFASTPTSPTLQPTSAPTSTSSTNNGSYAVFAAIAMILIVGLVVAQRTVGRNKS